MLKPGPKKGTPKIPGSGRKAGTLNKSSQTVKQRLALMECDIIEYMAFTVLNKVPCGVCRGTGKTKFQPAGGTRFSGERTCQSCWGSKLERLTPRERLDAAAKLLGHTEPILKAIDHSNSDGTMPRFEVRFVGLKGPVAPEV